MKTKPIPDGYHTVTPYLAVHGAPKVLEFLKQAFGAEEIARHTMPDGNVMNAEIKIGNSMVMVAEKHKDQKPPSSMLYLYVEDADAFYNSAIRAGGKSIMAPTDQFYGDRSGAVEDPSGNQWWIATRIEDLSHEEVMKRAREAKK